MTNDRPETSLVLSIHHVGGRDGTRAFPVLPRFEQDVFNVIYDADSDCLDQIRQRNERLRSKCLVLPYCLAGKTGRAVFNVNYDPYTSSLLEADRKYSGFYLFHRGTDYLLDECLKPMERRSIDTITLDDLYSGRQTEAPPPDFLSMDTQGSEFDILCGAKRLLHENVVAIVTEVEFHGIYRGQKLFGELSQFLTESGFHFVDFVTEGPSRFSPVRFPVGLRAGGFLISSNALFLRSTDGLVQDSNPFRRRIQLYKLAFISIVFGQIEYGVECLRRAGLAEPVSEHELSHYAYYRFLMELWSIAAETPLCYPPTFAGRHSFQASRSRFDSLAEGSSLVIRLKEALLRRPVLLNFARSAQERIVPLQLRFRRLLALRKRSRPRGRDYPFWGYSRIERHLIRYGLQRTASEMRRLRRIQELHCAATSGQSCLADLEPERRSTPDPGD